MTFAAVMCVAKHTARMGRRYFSTSTLTVGKPIQHVKKLIVDVDGKLMELRIETRVKLSHVSGSRDVKFVAKLKPKYTVDHPNQKQFDIYVFLL